MAFSKEATRSSNVLLGLGGGRQAAKESPISFRWAGVSRSTRFSSARTRCSADRLKPERSDIDSQSRVSSSHIQVDDSMEHAILSPNFRLDFPLAFRSRLALRLNPVCKPDNRTYFQIPILSLLTGDGSPRDGIWRISDRP